MWILKPFGQMVMQNCHRINVRTFECEKPRHAILVTVTLSLHVEFKRLRKVLILAAPINDPSQELVDFIGTLTNFSEFRTLWSEAIPFEYSVRASRVAGLHRPSQQNQK